MDEEGDALRRLGVGGDVATSALVTPSTTFGGRGGGGGGGGGGGCKVFRRVGPQQMMSRYCWSWSPPLGAVHAHNDATVGGTADRAALYC